jgi:spore coat protein U-like protein
MISRNMLRLGLGLAAFAMTGAAGAGCGLANAPVDMGFGAYTPISFAGRIVSANADSTGVVSISCTGLAQPVGYTIKLGAGRSNSIAARTLGGTGGGADMAYNLYANASRTLVWGDGATGASFSGTIAPTDGPVQHPFYGRVPSGQHALRAGTYTDALVITLEYSP